MPKKEVHRRKSKASCVLEHKNGGWGDRIQSCRKASIKGRNVGQMHWLSHISNLHGLNRARQSFNSDNCRKNRGYKSEGSDEHIANCLPVAPDAAVAKITARRIFRGDWIPGIVLWSKIGSYTENKKGRQDLRERRNLSVVGYAECTHRVLECTLHICPTTVYLNIKLRYYVIQTQL